MLPEPVKAVDLNIYGDATLPWDRVREALMTLTRPETPQFLGTVGASGSAHSAGVGSVEYDGALFFTSGPKTRKSRDLEANPSCSLSVRLPGVDLVLEGTARRVADAEVLARVTALYREHGWPAEPAGDAVTAAFSAQSAGPPPWHLYRLSVRTAVGVAFTPPHGATRWHFS